MIGRRAFLGGGLSALAGLLLGDWRVLRAEPGAVIPEVLAPRLRRPRRLIYRARLPDASELMLHVADADGCTLLRGLNIVNARSAKQIMVDRDGARLFGMALHRGDGLRYVLPEDDPYVLLPGQALTLHTVDWPVGPAPTPGSRIVLAEGDCSTVNIARVEVA